MAKNSKKAYQEANEQFLIDTAEDPDIKILPHNILYKVIKDGDGKQPTHRNVVTVYYKGMLINGKVFDDNTKQGYPDAFRLNELITGWQIALTQMHEGDKWVIYIPASDGYGAKGVSGIPGNSTLIFEIELVKVN